MKKAIVIALMPIVISIIGIIAVTSDHTPEVREFKESVRAGYETVPAEYDVTVAPAYRWSHGGHSTALVALGFLLFAVSGAYVWWVNKEAKKGSMVVIGIFWVLGLLAVFGTYSISYYGSKYHKRFTSEQYEQNKDDLHKLFQ